MSQNIDTINRYLDGSAFRDDLSPRGRPPECLRRVEEKGGKIIKAMRGDNGEYVNAVIQDPVGAYLPLISG